MKHTFGIGLLIATFLVTLCACGKPDGANQNTSSITPAASTNTETTSSSNPDPEEMATLYLMTAGKEKGQYELGYSGKLTGEQLLQGLTNLTGYSFDAGKVVLSGKEITVYWANTASFMPDTGKTAVPNKDLDLTFADFDSELRFMLDSTYTTFTKNLDVSKVRYVTADGGDLDFSKQATWVLSDQPYSGTFTDYYLEQDSTEDQDKSSTSNDASEKTKSGKEFIYMDRRSNPADSGNNISPEDAAQAVYDALVINYEGETDSGSDWYIALDKITTVKGSEGYSFSVGQGSEEEFAIYFHAVVTYDRNIYLLEDGASDYVLYGTIPKS